MTMAKPEYTAPAESEHAIKELSDLRLRAVTKSRQVGDHADVPEDDRDRSVSRDRENVPEQRRAELRPDVHREGQGKEPVPKPRTARVNQREQTGADHGKDGHGFSEAVDRVAPALLKEQQNGRDQRSGMADTDPPHKVDDGEAPRHRLRDTPDTGAAQEEPGNRDEQHRGPASSQHKAAKPAERRMAGEHDARELFGKRLEGVPGHT